LSVAFTREEDVEAAAAYLPERPISPHPNLVTRTGLEKLDADLAAAREAFTAAQSNKNLQADRSPMARAARDLRYFMARRASAQLVEPDTELREVVFGSRVDLRRADGRCQSFRIVGEDEADPARGSISYISPLARSLLGKRAGDVASLNDAEVEILAVDR
jgi:transcription elongation GreA/GreB family factor